MTNIKTLAEEAAISYANKPLNNLCFTPETPEQDRKYLERKCRFWHGYLAGYHAALGDAQDMIAHNYSSNHVANYHYLCAWLNAQIQETAKELSND